MSAYKEFIPANEKYTADFADKGGLPLPPGKKLTIVTCMDARLDPAAHLGIKEGDAHVIRNAGGVAKEALRSIIISQQLLGTREIALFHHTDCGMLTFKNEDLRNSLKEKYPSVTKEIESIDFFPFPQLERSVKDDIEFLKQHPLVLDETTITGWIYDVKTGKVSIILILSTMTDRSPFKDHASRVIYYFVDALILSVFLYLIRFQYSAESNYINLLIR
ncbi:carbonic anhydrase [Fomitiporia mediterranea MF3/22]|uniref:carbonic anhydrase n=1 Tax=Fomitiporia mediterranea (strain MF3/22) TaxID=694068 RepID=UPI0004408F67|nr:carbonic anhydrase [Fomitiporia mediterranea MF3/22]EJD04213.1 carbonic anhydrase [Fomitiporia mediterranea MF3/22]